MVELPACQTTLPEGVGVGIGVGDGIGVDVGAGVGLTVGAGLGVADGGGVGPEVVDDGNGPAAEAASEIVAAAIRVAHEPVPHTRAKTPAASLSPLSIIVVDGVITTVRYPQPRPSWIRKLPLDVDITLPVTRNCD